MRSHGMRLYTEHLSYTTDDGQLYDLLPIPFTADAVQHVARRIRRTQEILETRIAIENASFYVARADRGDVRAGVHQRRAAGGRLLAASGRQQHLRQQRELRLRPRRVHARPACRAGGLHAYGRPLSGSRRPRHRHPRRRRDRPGLGVARHCLPDLRSPAHAAGARLQHPAARPADRARSSESPPSSSGICPRCMLGALERRFASASSSPLRIACRF